MVRTWRHELVEHTEDLGRWFRGRVTVEPDPSDELITTQSLMDADQLRDAIARSLSTSAHHAARPSARSAAIRDPGLPGGSDLQVAASRLTRHYTASLTVAALVGLSQGIGLHLSADRRTVIIQHNLPWCLVLDAPDGEVLQCAERVAPWPVVGRTVDTLTELRERVWRRLYAENLQPLFEKVAQLTKISPALLWSNAAEWPGLISTAAVEYLDDAAAQPIVAECRALLDAPALPGVPGANPLSDKLEWVPGDGKGFPEVVQTRKMCCLNYLLQDRFGRLCQTCPYLPLEDRIALVRERHGVPMGTPGGKAEERSIEQGMARPSTRRVAKLRQGNS